MIVIGYPGVGKSTVSKRNIRYVDFDSSPFSNKEQWESDYVFNAEMLSSHGHVVFVSAHKAVQELLKNSKEKVVVVYPALRLHDFWIEKLKTRYIKTQNDGDYRALSRCVSHYCEDILELKGLPFPQIKIDEENYDLESMLSEYENSN